MAKRIHLSKLIAGPIAVLALVSHPSAYPDHSAWKLAFAASSLVLLGASALGRVWASAFLCGKKNSELVTAGPFSIVRNPLYFFSFLGFLGAGLAFGSITLVALFTLAFFVTHWPAILREEARLRSLFGETFETYARTVPRFVPHPAKLKQPESVSLSPARFSLAVVESFLVIGIFLVADTVEWVHTTWPKSILIYLP